MGPVLSSFVSRAIGFASFLRTLDTVVSLSLAKEDVLGKGESY